MTEKREGYYQTKRIYAVIDENGRIVASLECPIFLAADWKFYLEPNGSSDKRLLPVKTRDEREFLKEWQGNPKYDIIVGMADSLQTLVSSTPEIPKGQIHINAQLSSKR